MTEIDFTLTALVLLSLSLGTGYLVGYLVGEHHGIKQCQREAIQNGFGYDDKKRRFQWRSK